LIAADSSVVVDLLQDQPTAQRQRLEELLRDAKAVLAPVTVTELLSDPRGGRAIQDILPKFILLQIAEGYWERAGLLRAKLRKTGRKAALGDALIAQACIDANVPLLTRDADFAAFEKLGLKLA
jgi:predicted nucleic acid-binding protein